MELITICNIKKPTKKPAIIGVKILLVKKTRRLTLTKVFEKGSLKITHFVAPHSFRSQNSGFTFTKCFEEVQVAFAKVNEDHLSKF